MIALAAVVIATYVLGYLHVRQILAAERDRVNDLLTLLEAKAAPAEAAAYLRPVTDAVTGELIYSDDGLISVEVPS